MLLKAFAALFALAAPLPATAQTQSTPPADDRPGVSAPRPGATDGRGSRMEAPVGHRQPRADERPAEIPKDSTDTKIEQLNRDANRSLRICRNC